MLKFSEDYNGSPRSAFNTLVSPRGQHFAADRNGGRLCWGATGQGIGWRKLINTMMQGGALRRSPLLLAANIGLIDFPMP